jgi:Cu/Ag efflux protein CusF
MTMWFVLRTPLPQNLKVGDSVRFEMVQENGKQWVIVKIANK